MDSQSVVESIGEGVTSLRAGDLVIPTNIGECKTCENCIEYPLSYNGLMSDVAYHAQHVVKIDPQTPLSCGFSTGYGAAWKEAKVEIGSSVAVFGLGAVGRIIGIDKNSRKEAKGRAFGMTDFINPEESDKSIEELVRDLSDGMRVDYGVPSLINQAILSTKLGAGEESHVNINILGIIMGRTLKGSVFGGIKTKSDLPIIFEKCKNREIQLEELLTHEIKLEEANNAFELLKQPDCVKILINNHPHKYSLFLLLK
ncbi:hypothetical protein V6N11_017597 [Hibiscus sabdariffa]|uniref:Alcohol dehydrogenase N-terminal domain-containing protein n=1 Tax=Hibiscus sabdariffa TaxID=183260 RepID=A0ABR2TYH1_9ROSI